MNIYKLGYHRYVSLSGNPSKPHTRRKPEMYLSVKDVVESISKGRIKNKKRRSIVPAQFILPEKFLK